jgi:dTDP-4-dehydrorhamnose 3,5-epimerase-like enzyme
MLQQIPIHDLFIRPITPVEDPNAIRWPALRDKDHLLRRFGQVEVIRAFPGKVATMTVRQVADEIWALIEGQVEWNWHDLRRTSPTYDHQYTLICDQPVLVLVPFGVAFGYRPIEDPALLLRLTTHAEDENQEVSPPQGESES